MLGAAPACSDLLCGSGRAVGACQPQPCLPTSSVGASGVSAVGFIFGEAPSPQRARCHLSLWAYLLEQQLFIWCMALASSGGLACHTICYDMELTILLRDRSGHVGVSSAFSPLSPWYLGDKDATMTIIDVKILTAFLPEESDLKRLTNNVENYISQYETQTTANNGSVILYLTKVSNKQDTVISFSVYQTLKAELLQPAAVTIYEYYDSVKKCTTFYNVREDSGMLRKLCQGSNCKCAEGGCAVQKDAAADIKPEDLTRAACEQETGESTTDYASQQYAGPIAGVRQFSETAFETEVQMILNRFKSSTKAEIAVHPVAPVSPCSALAPVERERSHELRGRRAGMDSCVKAAKPAAESSAAPVSGYDIAVGAEVLPAGSRRPSASEAVVLRSLWQIG
ncbi:hypothetical protein NDU88_004462 [Pleurodeles waltl]|uniref:Alpha-macroglobulin receptor-binding domain-containing protein n=1 Tax=Pleurodeles waltl TaxID=8319 RepID=A0AAV7T865_PLEWA|nr:hypothetical protein NDU88_004462 [Pleurodeles waltl]